MFSLPIHPLIHGMHTLSSETVSVITFIFCMVAILGLLRGFGLAGLMAYTVIAVIAGNIQVQTASFLFFSDQPIALGTIVFGSTALVSDIITEFYGYKQAKRTIFLSIAMMIIFTLMMILTVGMSPSGLERPECRSFLEAHQAMRILFLPIPALILASLISYGISQWSDAWIFQSLAKLTHQKHLWLRTALSTLLSAFMDNCIFSVLAFMILSPTPLDGSTVWHSYIIGTYWFRLALSLCSTPVIYLAKRLIPQHARVLS